MTLLQQSSSRLSHDISKFVTRLPEGLSEKDVHRLRTTIRRVETLVTYAKPKLGKKEEKAMDEICALRKRAGKVRDLDIQISLLSSVGNGSASPDRRALADVLKKRRSKQLGRLQTAAKKLKGSRLFSLLAQIARVSGAREAEGPTARLKQVRRQFSQLAAQHANRRILKPARLHDLRIKLKLLRYQAELAGNIRETKGLVEEIKSVLDPIGEWHDWKMLAQNAEEYFSDRVNCAVRVEIQALLATRYSAAASAVTHLSAAYAPTAQKKPASAESPLSYAQRA
jgi:CHAD domain-containing protein